MFIKPFIPLVAIATSTQFINPNLNTNLQNNMLALSPQEVEKKLDTIFVFSPYLDEKSKSKGKSKNVSDKNDLEIKSITFPVDGVDTEVYLAAFSPSAVNIMKSYIFNNSNEKKEVSESITFLPTSLAKFESLIKEKRKSGKAPGVIHIPDPDQSEMARKLLIKQGTSEDKVDYLVTNSPMIFCTKPSIRATLNESDSSSYIPCSTDHQTISNLITKIKPKKKGWFSKEKMPELVVVPLPQFISTLESSEDPNISDIRLLPSPSSLEVLKKLYSKTNKNK